MNINKNISRREFLKLSGLTAGALIIPWHKAEAAPISQEWSVGANLGRVSAGEYRSFIPLKTEPNVNAPDSTLVWRDDVLEINQEVVANQLDFNQYKQRWFETPAGYIMSKLVQPVKNLPNQPVSTLPSDEQGQPGMWVEITVPKLDFELTKPWSQASSWIRDSDGLAKLYYSQVYWVSDIRQANGRTEYLLSERFGALPDSFWVDARACRPITKEEIAPIHPDVGDKKVLVNLEYQTLQCFEGSREVYFCEVSTGWKRDGKFMTPPGSTPVWRKLVSLHMSAGGVYQYDLPGVAWTTIFHSEGQAIHSAYWHNDFTNPLTHGCINCLPHDAKWIWRWINPVVDLLPGELTVSNSTQSTFVQVVES